MRCWCLHFCPWLVCTESRCRSGAVLGCTAPWAAPSTPSGHRCESGCRLAHRSVLQQLELCGCCTELGYSAHPSVMARWLCGICNP